MRPLKSKIFKGVELAEKILTEERLPSLVNKAAEGVDSNIATGEKRNLRIARDTMREEPKKKKKMQKRTKILLQEFLREVQYKDFFLLCMT